MAPAVRNCSSTAGSFFDNARPVFGWTANVGSLLLFIAARGGGWAGLVGAPPAGWTFRCQAPGPGGVTWQAGYTVLSRVCDGSEDCFPDMAGLFVVPNSARQHWTAVEITGADVGPTGLVVGAVESWQRDKAAGWVCTAPAVAPTTPGGPALALGLFMVASNDQAVGGCWFTPGTGYASLDCGPSGGTLHPGLLVEAQSFAVAPATIAPVATKLLYSDDMSFSGLVVGEAASGPPFLAGLGRVW